MADSGKAVPHAPTHYQDGLEVVPHTEDPATQKYPYYSPEVAQAQPAPYSDTNKIAYETTENGAYPPTKTICGLRKRTFWILVVVAIVIVAAAVGGGVGGALSSKSSKTSNDSPAAASPGSPSSSAGASSDAPSGSSTATPTTSTASVTTTDIIGPSSTIKRDCPSANDTLYTATLGSTSFSFRKICNDALTNNNGIASSIGTVVSSLNECINLCVAYNVNNRTRIEAGTDKLCNAVCWRNTFDKANDWPGGMCFGYETRNTTVDGQTAFRVNSPQETICDGAGMIDGFF